MVCAFLTGALTERAWFADEDFDSLRRNVLLIAAVFGKLSGMRLAGRLLHWQPGEASLVGWLLQTKALIMIIFANILLDKGVITATSFTALLLMAIGSTMLTIPVVTPLLRRLQSLVAKSD
jgi:Kef-type K+ transport system membrane component KefB